MINEDASQGFGNYLTYPKLHVTCLCMGQQPSILQSNAEKRENSSYYSKRNFGGVCCCLFAFNNDYEVENIQASLESMPSPFSLGSRNVAC